MSTKPRRLDQKLSEIYAGTPPGGKVPSGGGFFSNLVATGSRGIGRSIPIPKPDYSQFEESELRTALVRLQEIYKYLEKVKRIAIEIPPSMMANEYAFNAGVIEGSKKLILEDIKHITEAITRKMSGETEDGDECEETVE